MLIGNGSNLLVSDLGIEGVVIKIGSNMSNITVENNIVKAEAGARLSALCSHCLENSLSGLQFAWGIPGSVGGAAYMNAGAYGGEMKDVVMSVTHLTKDGKVETFKADMLNFGYTLTVTCIVFSPCF